MHETVLIKNLVSILEKETAGPEVGDIKIICLEVGELRYIVPEIMELSFRHTPKSPKLRRAKIKMIVLPVKAKCCQCGKEILIKERNFQEAVCCRQKMRLISGDEFNLKSVVW